MVRREPSISGLPIRRGKVRDVYDLGDSLLIVATDRISAFDWVLPNEIPDKGRVLTELSAFWFHRIACDPVMEGVSHHLLSTDVNSVGLDLTPSQREALQGRVMIVRKARVIPFECVVRGYLSGSAWKDYCRFGRVCGHELPTGLSESSRIRPLFTPATKAESGHDENVSTVWMKEALGDPDLVDRLERLSIALYEFGAAYAESRGLILADTKFEWGFDARSGELMLIDEVLTPDSSRYWPASEYQPGRPQPSFDKQFIRDWLEGSGWDKASPPPPLPDDVIAKTRMKYIDAYQILTGQTFPWT